jgi:Flp pilus assembly CpaF family ATPase
MDAGPPSLGGGPPSLGEGPPAMDAGPPSLGGGPPAMDAGPPSLGEGPPAMDAGPPSLGEGPPAMDGGPPSLGGGPPAMDAGPPSLGGGPPAMDAGPPSLGGGPPAMDAGPPSLGGGPPAMDAGPPSLGAGPDAPPSLAPGPDAPPSLGAGPDAPPSLAAGPDAPPPAEPTPPPSSRPAPPKSFAEPEQEIDMRPEYAARAAVFYELLSDLGAAPAHPPDDGEKQRKAARVGAKRRLAVIARNDPDLMLDDPGTEAEHLLAELFALGPLSEPLADEQVCEVLIRSPQRIYIDRGNGRERLERGFSCAAAVSMTLHRYAGTHLQWDAAAPWLDHRMPDGTRLRGADPSVAPDGPVVVIQRPSRAGVGGLSQVGSVSDPLADYLRAVLRGQGSVLVCVGDRCEGTELLSALAHELGQIDVGRFGIVRAGSSIVPPHGALVLDAEPGLTAGPIRLAIEAGSSRLLVHRAGGAGLASVWAGLPRGVEQVVLGLGVSDPEAALATCVEGLVLGGYGRDRQALRRQICAAIDVIVVLGLGPRGDEVPTMLAEFDEQGGVSPVLSRSSPTAAWQRHRDPAFVAELAQRGVTFDASKLAGLAGG